MVANRTLLIYFNDALVGHLEKKTKLHFLFQYDAAWLALPGARPISLSLPLLTKQFEGPEVYAFFDNLLPDNPKIRAQIQSHFHLPSAEVFDLLCAIGRDCVGAIRLCAPDLSLPSNRMRAFPLTKTRVALLLRTIHQHPLGMTEKNTDFRISIAGAQEKSALLYWKKKWHFPMGATPTTHIFKLPIGELPHQGIDLTDSCENEWLCAQIAAAFGLPVASCFVEEFSQVKALVVTRFDRKLSRSGKKIVRLPQEDLCQALGVFSEYKYQSEGGPGISQIMKF